MNETTYYTPEKYCEKKCQFVSTNMRNHSFQTLQNYFEDGGFKWDGECYTKTNDSTQTYRILKVTSSVVCD